MTLFVTVWNTLKGHYWMVRLIVDSNPAFQPKPINLPPSVNIKVDSKEIKLRFTDILLVL